MPAKRPSYTLHKASGQARVRINGHDHYLGPYDSPQSHELYDELITEWLTKRVAAKTSIVVADIVLLYLRHAKKYYRLAGDADEGTSEVDAIVSASRPLVKRFGRYRAALFGPLRLKEVRDDMIKLGWARSNINQQVGRLRRMFRWAASEELIEAKIVTSLETVSGLSAGRSDAKEGKPVAPVDDAVVNETLPFLSGIVADMVRLQRLTGARPSEICILRPADVDRSGEVWEYRPKRHKTGYRGKERRIFLGPQSQDVLRPYLLRPADAYCFSPEDAENERREAATANRKTPANFGNRPGTNRRENPRRKPGNQYTRDSYRRAIDRAVKAANKARKKEDPDSTPLPHWFPHQLRHTAGTVIRRRFGLDSAQAALGHATADVTQIYADVASEKAREVAAAVG